MNINCLLFLWKTRVLDTDLFVLDVYKLEKWAVTECAGEGTSKALARQKAAELLLQGEKYCVSSGSRHCTSDSVTNVYCFA
jgi:hypothetical protein